MSTYRIFARFTEIRSEGKLRFTESKAVSSGIRVFSKYAKVEILKWLGTIFFLHVLPRDGISETIHGGSTSPGGNTKYCDKSSTRSQIVIKGIQ